MQWDIMEKKDVRESVLAVLDSKEKAIEALRRELEEKNNAVEILEQREGKSKGHVLKLKAMIQPLGDELVNQKKRPGAGEVGTTIAQGGGGSKRCRAGGEK